MKITIFDSVRWFNLKVRKVPFTEIQSFMNNFYTVEVTQELKKWFSDNDSSFFFFYKEHFWIGKETVLID